MDIAEFRTVHNVVIDFLDHNTLKELEVIGKWYYQFLLSDEEKFNLHLPYYSVETSKIAFRYVRIFTVVFNLIDREDFSQYQGTCLYDVFNNSTYEKLGNLQLDFLKKNDDYALWGLDTLTRLDSFLPVFIKEELGEYDNRNTINSTFKLFKRIRDSRIIDVPTLISLRERVLSFNNLEDTFDELISEKMLFLENTLEDQVAEKLEGEFNNKQLKNRIVVKYPYSKKPHPYLMDVGEKKFKIVFNNRFCYGDIQKEDIYLSGDETNFTTQLEFNVVNTNHSKELYELFKNFKENWNRLELNKYVTPFPKYWFLFLNDSLTVQDWISQFKKDFPAVAEKPIIKIVERIIEEVINLNWIEGVVSDSTKILFPELKSLRKKRLEFVFNNFKNHVESINANVHFISTVGDCSRKDVLLLDSFNIIDLINRNLNTTDLKINVVVPDFLYFGYQPWIKYHLFNYQFTPLIEGLREQLDSKFSSNQKKIEVLRKELVAKVKSDFRSYRNKYEITTKKEELDVELDETPNFEDLEFTNLEENENISFHKERQKKFVLINESQETQLKLSTSEKVLLQKDTLIYISAGNLHVGDLIIRNSDILELFMSEIFYNKLTNIPSNIRNYQKELSGKDNVYQKLKRKGISYQDENYFNVKYLLEKTEEDSLFIIPKRKKDWGIICQFLNIDYSLQQLAFIAYYGRSRQNELKKMYKSIIQLLLDNNWLGTIDDPSVIASVSEIVNRYKGVFSVKENFEISEVSESIISTILDQLCFTEIRTIKTIGNE